MASLGLGFPSIDLGSWQSLKSRLKSTFCRCVASVGYLTTADGCWIAVDYSRDRDTARLGRGDRRVNNEYMRKDQSRDGFAAQSLKEYSAYQE